MDSKKERKKTARINRAHKLIAKLLSLVLVFTTLVHLPLYIGAAETESDQKLQNGGFEKDQSFTNNAYAQVNQNSVPSWNTTATDGKIELFKKNSNVYVKNDSGAWVTLIPTEGTYAAELNCDEESTLYQTVKTTPSSIYEWGLDHGARNGKDIMALVIGPNQSVAPSKPSKAGRDQFMQMVDWLGIDSDTIVSGAEPKHYVVYSKKFAAAGTFEDNAGNNAFSLTPSTIFTEEWHIWIMASDRAKTETVNPWNSFGSNDEGSAGSSVGSSSGVQVGLNKYYLYTVPSGQTHTLFGFVSVGYLDSPTTADKAKTYGNFLDNINFQLYHSLSGSTSNHGSAVIGGSDGSAEGEGGSDGYKVTVNDKYATYVIHGEPLKIQAYIKKEDVADGCEFVGIYHTKQDENGNPVTEFLRTAGNVIEDTGNLTEAEKAGKWVKSTKAGGDTVYTYYLQDISSATDLHFVFIKSPTITYDANGGKPYAVEREYNTTEAENVYSYKPASGHNEAEAGTDTIFIAPYVSKAAEGQNDGWKFMGWKLTGDTIDGVADEYKVNAGSLGSLILPAVHTVSCDYAFEGIGGDSKAQSFKIYNGNVTLAKNIDNNAAGESVGVKWTDNGETVAYANAHKGLTLVAQWRWLQAFIPQVGSDSSYTNSESGGTVEIISVADKSDTNYNAAYNANGGKSYHAKTDETVAVKAIAKTGYTFEGWYDEDGNLITTNDEYSYTEAKESVKTFYARFSGNIVQTYIRQVKDGDAWVNTEDDKVGTLGRYSYTDAPGVPISSTATAASGYKFVGWYDANGNAVSDDMLINDGVTISYTTTGDATYYARFETAYTVKFAAQTKQSNGTFKTDNVGGKVSVASVSDLNGAMATSKATANSNYKFIGWYDKDGNLLTTIATYSKTISPEINKVTYYARFERLYTVKFEPQTEQMDGTYVTDNVGGKVSVSTVTNTAGATATSKATANSNHKFIGWYDKDGKLLTKNAEYSVEVANDVTYYARFVPDATCEDRVYLSFVSEKDEGANVPDIFSDSDVKGTGGNYCGNTISTGFMYKLNTTTDVSTVQITITVPATAYVKIGENSEFEGDGNPIIADSSEVLYNRGSIQKIKGAVTLKYYWNASGLSAGETYGFVLDCMYAPGATATVTINGKDGVKVTSENGVVNTSAAKYRAKSHYPKK